MKSKMVQFPIEVIDAIMKNLEEIQVKGSNSVTRMAMVFQDMNSKGVVIEVAEEGDNNGKN